MNPLAHPRGGSQLPHPRRPGLRARRRRRRRRRGQARQGDRRRRPPGEGGRPATPRSRTPASARKQMLQDSEGTGPPADARLGVPERQAQQAGFSFTRDAVLDRRRVLGVAVVRAPCCPARAGCRAAWALGLVAALGLPRWVISFLGATADEEVHRALLRRHRHHRPRHQVRPAGARLPAGDRPREPGAAGGRIPPPGREHLHGHGRRSGAGEACTSACRRRRCASSPSCCHPAEDRRQPRRGAGQPLRRAARTQADAREDQGAVVGSHRPRPSSSARCRWRWCC